MSLCSETLINTPLMHKVQVEDKTKHEMQPHSSVVKRGYVSTK